MVVVAVVAATAAKAPVAMVAAVAVDAAALAATVGLQGVKPRLPSEKKGSEEPFLCPDEQGHQGVRPHLPAPVAMDGRVKGRAFGQQVGAKKVLARAKHP